MTTNNDNASFDESVAHILLHPPPQSGIVVLEDGEKIPLPPIESVYRSSIDPSTLPSIPPSSLPLPLDHPARCYRSAVPGINLTHPLGSLIGGPLDQTAEQKEALVRRVAGEHGARNQKEFWAAVEREREAVLGELRERARARVEAEGRNAGAERELEALREKRALEVRAVERRMGNG